jgi:O-acetyl-ADP-ribose deacetylase (regulator of RNase III)
MNIELKLGDITTIPVDVIVNAANTSLLGGGGVDGAIHRKGGHEIFEDCVVLSTQHGGCKVGEAVYTRAGKLPAQYVIHTVGPIWYGGVKNEEKLLKSCYIKSLQLANKLGVKTVSFPNISTGVYRFPKEKAAQIALQSIKDYEEILKSLQIENTITTVIFVCFEQANYDIYKNLLRI